MLGVSTSTLRVPGSQRSKKSMAPKGSRNLSGGRERGPAAGRQAAAIHEHADGALTVVSGGSKNHHSYSRSTSMYRNP